MISKDFSFDWTTFEAEQLFNLSLLFPPERRTGLFCFLGEEKTDAWLSFPSYYFNFQNVDVSDKIAPISPDLRRFLIESISSLEKYYGKIDYGVAIRKEAIRRIIEKQETLFDPAFFKRFYLLFRKRKDAVVFPEMKLPPYFLLKIGSLLLPSPFLIAVFSERPISIMKVELERGNLSSFGTLPLIFPEDGMWEIAKKRYGAKFLVLAKIDKKIKIKVSGFPLMKIAGFFAERKIKLR
jgi:hypothetical protein